MEMKASIQNNAIKMSATNESKALQLKAHPAFFEPSNFPAYDGEYVITPKVNEDQVLETKGKRMTENITVEEVPISVTSTPGGGKTIYIGIK